MNHLECEAPLGSVRLGEVFLRLVQVLAINIERRIVAENAVRKRSGHEVGIACSLEDGLIIDRVGNRLAHVDISEWPILGVHFDREGSVLRL